MPILVDKLKKKNPSIIIFHKTHNVMVFELFSQMLTEKKSIFADFTIH